MNITLENTIFYSSLRTRNTASWDSPDFGANTKSDYQTVKNLKLLLLQRKQNQNNNYPIKNKP
jgi:hypothetical protein